MIADILLSIFVIFLIVVIVKLLRSENKTKRIWGKVLLGILIAPIIVFILFFLGCLAILSAGKFF